MFHFDVQGSVAKSTHAGIPWLHRIKEARPNLHFWPFDGWLPPNGSSVVLETYPRLWSAKYPVEERTADQHDAYAISRWLQEADRSGLLLRAINPPEPEAIAMTGKVEGWILGSKWPPQSKMAPAKTKGKTTSGNLKTTEPGYVNRNRQEVICGTDLPGNDHNQVVYILHCHDCGMRYGANGSDIFQRRCPGCGGGRTGLRTE